jgi:hypothetical protein
LVPGLLGDDFFRRPENQRLRNRMTEKCFVVAVRLRCPFTPVPVCKLSKILLRSLANNVRMSAPDIQIFGEISFRYELGFWILQIELFPLGYG